MAAVSELLLKKRKRQEAWAAEKATAAAAQKKNALAARKTVFKRAEAYAKEYRAAVRLSSEPVLLWDPGVDRRTGAGLRAGGGKRD